MRLVALAAYHAQKAEVLSSVRAKLVPCLGRNVNHVERVDIINLIAHENLAATTTDRNEVLMIMAFQRRVPARLHFKVSKFDRQIAFALEKGLSRDAHKVCAAVFFVWVHGHVCPGVFAAVTPNHSHQ